MSQQDLMCDVERLDRELHQQIQWKLEACKKAEDLQSKLTEMEQVLSWASENVDSVIGPIDADLTWTVIVRTTENKFDAPTLYAALKSAWEAREK